MYQTAPRKPEPATNSYTIKNHTAEPVTQTTPLPCPDPFCTPLLPNTTRRPTPSRCCARNRKEIGQQRLHFQALCRNHTVWIRIFFVIMQNMQRRQTGTKQETSPQEPPGILPLSKSHDCRIPPAPRSPGGETRQTEKLLLVRLHQVEPSRFGRALHMTVAHSGQDETGR